MGITKYILDDDHNIVVCTGLQQWLNFFDNNELRRVANNEVNSLTVSTVFLGVDHNFGEGKPIVFETMIFGDDEEYQERYSTWKEAEEGHKRAIEHIISNKLGVTE